MDCSTYREARRIRNAVYKLTGNVPSVFHYDTGGYSVRYVELGSRDSDALLAYLHDGNRWDRITWEAIDRYRND